MVYFNSYLKVHFCFYIVLIVLFYKSFKEQGKSYLFKLINFYIIIYNF